MRNLAILSLLLLPLTLPAQVDQKIGNNQLAYYGDLDFKKVNKDGLHKILAQYHIVQKGKPDTITSTCVGSCYRHTSVGYDGARKILFGELYKLTDAEGTYVQDVYCGKKFYFNNISDVGNMHTEVNIEHTWPQSKFNHNHDKTMQKSDMHHLYLTDSLANNRRGNHEFGNADNRVDELNVQNCSSSKLTDISGHFIFTPPAGHRGNVARALFYFATRYNLFIGKAEELILRQWHKQDPIDAAEKSRHEIIAKYQKVRNPFVDYPELVEKIADF